MSITSYFFQVQTSWTWRVLKICLWVCRSLHREKDLHYLEVLDLPCYQFVSSSQVILKIDSRTWKWLVHPKTLTVISWNHYLTRLAWLDHISCAWARGVDSFLTVVHGVLPIALLRGGSVSRFWFCTYSKCIWMPFVWSTAHCWPLMPSLIATWGDALDFQTRPTGFFFVLYKSSILEMCCLRASGLHTTSDHWAMSLKLFHPFW